MKSDDFIHTDTVEVPAKKAHNRRIKPHHIFLGELRGGFCLAIVAKIHTDFCKKTRVVEERPMKRD